MPEEELNENLENENTEEETGGEQDPTPVTYEPNKTITFQEELEGGAKGAVLYPKTIVSQVEGLDEVLKTEVLKNFDFAVAPAKTGHFEVDGVANSPFGEDTIGTIDIMQTGEGEYLEKWTSKNYDAYRELKQINPLTAGVNYLKINNKLVDTGLLSDAFNEDGVKIVDDVVANNTVRTVELEEGGTYTLSGALTNTRIKVVSANKGTTKLILNGLFIHFNNTVDTEDDDTAKSNVDDSEPMILFSKEGTYELEIAEGSYNYFKRDSEVSVNSSTGVIYEDNKKGSLTVSGTGYIGIDSWLGGHGIKTKGSLTINGKIHLSARAYHDILHGNLGLTINGGYFHAFGCNDFLGADTSVGDQNVAPIVIKNGVFYAEEVGGTFLQGDDAKVYPGVIVRYKNVGEGLWLQADEGNSIVFNAKGLVAGYATISSGRFIYKAYKEPMAYEAFDESQVDSYTTKKSDCKDQEFPGITVYQGVTLIPVDGGVYKESVRNTCMNPNAGTVVAESTNGKLFTPVRTFEFTPTTEVAEDAHLEADAHFDEIIYQYNETIFGGIWHFNTSKEELSEVRGEAKLGRENLLKEIIPMKTLGIRVRIGEDILTADKDGVYFVVPDPILAADADLVNGELPEDPETYTYKGLKSGKDVFTSKTGIMPTIRLRAGEKARIYAVIDPVNVTNMDLKWTVAEESDFTVIGREKSEDTHYCDVIGLQPGEDSIILSAKSLDKTFSAVKMKIHFDVIAKEQNYEIVDLPKETTELDDLKEELGTLEEAANRFMTTAVGQYSVIEGFEEKVKVDEILPAYASYLPVLENYIALSGTATSTVLRFQVLETLEPAINGANLYRLPIEYTLSSEGVGRVPMGHVPVYAEKDVSAMQIGGETVDMSGQMMLVDGTQIASVFFISGTDLGGPGLFVSAPLVPGIYWLQGNCLAVEPEFLEQLAQAL